MAARFSLISAAVFAGVVIAGGLVSSGAVNPVDALDSLRRNNNSAPRVFQDQSALAGSSGTIGQQTTETSFAPSGSQPKGKSGDHREGTEHHGDGEKDDGEDD